MTNVCKGANFVVSFPTTYHDDRPNVAAKLLRLSEEWLSFDPVTSEPQHLTGRDRLSTRLQYIECMYLSCHYGYVLDLVPLVRVRLNLAWMKDMRNQQTV